MKKLTAYILKDVPADLWQSFKVKCAQDGISMRKKMMELIASYIGEKQ